MPANNYKFEDFDATITKIDDVTKSVMKFRKGDQQLGAHELKDKLGDKVTMAALIVRFTNVCLETKDMLKKLHGHNFEMQGKVADMSSSSMKKMAEELKSNQSDIMTQLAEFKQETKTISGESKSFAEIVGDMKEELVVPMKRAIKELEKEDELSRNIVIHGLDIDPSLQTDEVKKAILLNADEVMIEAGPDRIHGSSKKVESYTIIGNVGMSGKAPPVLVKMKSAIDARNALKYATKLSRTPGFARVYITPDLSKEDRLKRKELQNLMKQKIQDFPDQHWVIRQGRVTSKGSYRSKKDELDDDEIEELDSKKSYEYY